MTDEELKALFDAMRSHFDASMDTIRRGNADEHDTTRRHFDVTREAMDHEMRLIAESVQHLDEKLDRTRDTLEQKIEASAAETQAMIKFSHVELDRRVRTLEVTQRTLEENVSDLQARVERLESSTH